MIHSRKIRFRATLLLTFALVASLIGGRTPSPESQASTISTAVVNPSGQGGIFGYAKIVGSEPVIRNQKNDFRGAVRHVESVADDNRIIDNLGNLMAEQMSSYVNTSGGSSVIVSSVSSTELASLNQDLRNNNMDGDFTDIVTKITFKLQNNTLPASVTDAGDALFYVEQAISRQPMLCCLFTMILLDQSKTSLTVYSPIASSKLRETTAAYVNTLNEILKVPKNNTGMSDADRYLYLHDEITAMAEYSVGRIGTWAIDYTPVGVMLNNLGVCQSYAAVFNQAARNLGLTSYVIDSNTHAWNAVLLNGKWYYVDTTWDDTRTSVQGKDKVSHTYFLVNQSEAGSTTFANGHILSSEYATHFSEITGNLGTGYDSSSYAPKKTGITTQMGYTNGSFYYSKDNRIYSWISNTNKNIEITGLPTAVNRRVSVLDSLLYFSGSDGMYWMNPSDNRVNRLDSQNYSGMYEAAGKLYVTTGGSYYIYKDVSSPVPTTEPGSSNIPIVTVPPASSSPSPGSTLTPQTSATPAATATAHGIPTVPPMPTVTPYDPTLVTPTPTPGSSAAPTSEPSTSFTAPGKTSITKLKNKKTRSAYIKCKKVSGASHYQIQYSTTKAMTGRPIHHTLTSSTTIGNLFKNKTYYFRARAVKVRSVNGTLVRKYGKWSAKKKVKIKK